MVERYKRGDPEPQFMHSCATYFVLAFGITATVALFILGWRIY